MKLFYDDEFDAIATRGDRGHPHQRRSRRDLRGVRLTAPGMSNQRALDR